MSDYLDVSMRVGNLERALELHDKILDRLAQKMRELKTERTKNRSRTVRCNSIYEMPSDIPALKCYLNLGHKEPCRWSLEET